MIITRSLAQERPSASDKHRHIYASSTIARKTSGIPPGTGRPPKPTIGPTTTGTGWSPDPKATTPTPPEAHCLQIDDGQNPVVYDFDPFGRLTTVDAVSYSYDGLDRVATRGSDTFTYQGTNLDPTSDSTHTYSRSPAGRLVGISDGTTNLSRRCRPAWRSHPPTQPHRDRVRHCRIRPLRRPTRNHRHLQPPSRISR